MQRSPSLLVTAEPAGHPGDHWETFLSSTPNQQMASSSSGSCGSSGSANTIDQDAIYRRNVTRLFGPPALREQSALLSSAQQVSVKANAESSFKCIHSIKLRTFQADIIVIMIWFFLLRPNPTGLLVAYSGTKLRSSIAFIEL